MASETTFYKWKSRSAEVIAEEGATNGLKVERGADDGDGAENECKSARVGFDNAKSLTLAASLLRDQRHPSAC